MLWTAADFSALAVRVSNSRGLSFRRRSIVEAAAVVAAAVAAAAVALAAVVAAAAASVTAIRTRSTLPGWRLPDSSPFSTETLATLSSDRLEVPVSPAELREAFSSTLSAPGAVATTVAVESLLSSGVVVDGDCGMLVPGGDLRLRALTRIAPRRPWRRALRRRSPRSARGVAASSRSPAPSRDGRVRIFTSRAGRRSMSTRRSTSARRTLPCRSPRAPSSGPATPSREAPSWPRHRTAATRDMPAAMLVSAEGRNLTGSSSAPPRRT